MDVESLVQLVINHPEQAVAGAILAVSTVVAVTITSIESRYESYPKGVIEIDHSNMASKNSVLRMQGERGVNESTDIAVLRFELAELEKEEPKSTAYDVLARFSEDILAQYSDVDPVQYEFRVRYGMDQYDRGDIIAPPVVFDEVQSSFGATGETVVNALEEHDDGVVWQDHEPPEPSENDEEYEDDGTWAVAIGAAGAG